VAKRKWAGGSNADPLPKTFEGKSTKLGGGGRFARIEAAAEKSGAKNPAAVAAAAGIKKYGKEKMTKMAVAGRKHNK
jgi:hypothetical protein